MRLHRSDDGAAVDAECGKFDVGNLDEDFFFLLADDVNLRDVLDADQFAANPIRVDFFVSKAVALTGQRKNIAKGIAELIVEKRPLAARWQRLTNIADALTHLILDARYLCGWYRVIDIKKHLAFAGAGITSDVKMRQFFETFFNLVGDLQFDLTGCRARPDGAHRHQLECEWRIFGLP